MPQPPPTAILDTLARSALDYAETDPSQFSRGGLVQYLHGDPSQALAQCLTAINMPALGDAVTIGSKTLYFRRLIIVPTEASDTAAVQLIYDNRFGGTNSALTITFRTFEQEYMSNRIPGSRIPIKVPDYTTTINVAGDKKKGPTIKGDLAMVRFSFPMRQVTVSGIKQGNPPAHGTYDANAGGVNERDFLGLPAGWWKFGEGYSSQSVYSGYYQFSASAVTKNLEDYSVYEILYNQRIGRYVEIPDADEQTLHRAEYKFGVMAEVPGCVRVGPYPTIDFDPLFTALPAAPHPFANLLGQTPGVGPGTA